MAATASRRALRRSPQNIGPRRVGAKYAGSISDDGRPGSWGWGEDRYHPESQAFPAIPPGGNPDMARGWPAWNDRAKNFALDGWYVPHHIWKDGMARVDLSDPLWFAAGQRMAFGFVQRGYRYCFPLADLGVAQGHPVDHVLPVCAGQYQPGTDMQLADGMVEAGRRYSGIPAQVRLRR